jgi:lipopolysaccharide export system protein LptA
MKLRKLLLLLIIALMVTFVGCKKGPDKLITKTWKVTNVVSKGTYADSVFQPIKADLMKAEMNFKDNKFTMSQNGNVTESGTYALNGDKITVTTEKGMNMDAMVTKESLTLDSPDFTTTLIPK